jgi:hypothetical protein
MEPDLPDSLVVNNLEVGVRHGRLEHPGPRATGLGAEPLTLASADTAHEPPEPVDTRAKLAPAWSMDSGTLGFIAIILLLVLLLGSAGAGSKAVPRTATVLTVAVLVLVGAQLAVKYFADDPTPPRPVQSPACAEAARLAAHGVTGGASYNRARDACTRAGG